jgi:hypothetical protein
MSEAHKKTWMHNAMLLGALAAGTITTQLVPAYQEHLGTVTYPSRAAASRSDASRENSGSFSHTRHSGPELTVVRSSS